jgi:flagellar hook assembly protein FlgD
LFSDNVKPGMQTLTWNGKDNSGKEVSSGSYICKMTAGSFHDSKKMIFIK